MEAIVLASIFNVSWPLNSRSWTFFRIGRKFLVEFLFEHLDGLGIKKIRLVVNNVDKKYVSDLALDGYSFSLDIMLSLIHI